MSDRSLIPAKFSTITPSDTAPIGPTIGIYCGSGGNVNAAGVDGVSAIFAVSAGQYLTGHFHMVLATNTTTTAGTLVALRSE